MSHCPRSLYIVVRSTAARASDAGFYDCRDAAAATLLLLLLLLLL